jgi:hypothetical protein
VISAWIGNVYRLVSGNTAAGLLPHILVNRRSYLKSKKNIQCVTAEVVHKQVTISILNIGLPGGPFSGRTYNIKERNGPNVVDRACYTKEDLRLQRDRSKFALGSPSFPETHSSEG